MVSSLQGAHLLSKAQRSPAPIERFKRSVHVVLGARRRTQAGTRPRSSKLASGSTLTDPYFADHIRRAAKADPSSELLHERLFSPFTLRGLTLPNRIVVSPMCQYSAAGGEANAWHLIHLGNLALSGAAMLCIEATAVEPEGRITPGCLGLWDDATEAALRPVLAAIREHSRLP